MSSPPPRSPSPGRNQYNKFGGRFSPSFSPKPIWFPPGTPSTWAGSTVGSATSCSSPANGGSIARPASEPSTVKGLSSGRKAVAVSAPVRVKEAWGPREPSREPAKESDRAQRRANSRFKREAVPTDFERPERCTRCTKDEMWLAYDVFRSLDKRKRQSISRTDFLEALKDFHTLDKLKALSRENDRINDIDKLNGGLAKLSSENRETVNKLKILKRSRLDHRFRESTQDVDLPEFLRMLWPLATEEDMVKMVRWAQLREAQAVLRDGKFRGEVAELKKIFDLLDENGDGLLSVNELRRASILNTKEIQTLMRTQRLDAKMSFHDFCIYAQTHLKAMYVSAATAQQMKEEANQAHNEDFQSSFRAAFARQN